MRIEDRLDKNTKNKLVNLRKPRNKKKKKRNVERFSEREILDLMGVSRDRYERRGGAVRRK